MATKTAHCAIGRKDRVKEQHSAKKDTLLGHWVIGRNVRLPKKRREIEFMGSRCIWTGDQFVGTIITIRHLVIIATSHKRTAGEKGT